MIHTRRAIPRAALVPGARPVPGYILAVGGLVKTTRSTGTAALSHLIVMKDTNQLVPLPTTRVLWDTKVVRPHLLWVNHPPPLLLRPPGKHTLRKYNTNSIVTTGQ